MRPEYPIFSLPMLSLAGKFIIPLMLFMMAYSLTYAQPDIQWEHALGGSIDDAANDIEQTADGGYVLAGNSSSSDGDVRNNNGAKDYWIVKLDATGQLQWEKNLGGSGIDAAQDIEQTKDGGFIVAGYSESSEGDVGGNKGEEDYWIVKLDEKGKLKWDNNYGGSSREIARSIEQTEDGGYVVAGWSRSNDGDISVSRNWLGEDYWILKLDLEGQLEWEKSLGGSNLDKAWSIEQTEDGGFVVAGLAISRNGDITSNNGLADYWIGKLAATGELQWEKNLGGSDRDEAHDIEQKEDGGYVVAGVSESSDGDVGGNNGEGDFWIVMLNEIGQLQWEKNFGGSKRDAAYDIEQTKDGGFVVAGISDSSDGNVGGNNGEDDQWVLQLDENGQVEWEKNLGGSNFEIARATEQTKDGGFVVAGNSRSRDGDVSGNTEDYDYWVVKLGERDVNLGPDTTICKGDSLLLSVIGLKGDSLAWNTGDTTEQIVVREPGTYHATIRASDTVVSDTVEVSFAQRPKVYVGPSRQAFCGQIDTTLVPETKNAQTYRWNTGDNTKTLYVDEEGQYWLRVESEKSCANADTTELAEIAYPESLDTSQLTVCQDEVELDAGNPGASHQWSTGDTTQTLTVRTDGRYAVQIANEFCAIRDTVQVKVDVEEACPYIWVPNSFSPNDDGLNEVFKPKAQKIRDYKMTIYNRWGERVFQSKKVDKGWNGIIDGRQAPAGVYLYQIDYRLRNANDVIRRKVKEETIQLVR